MAVSSLDFEKPLAELEEQISELESAEPESPEDETRLAERLDRSRVKLEGLRNELYGNLTAWQRVQIARHPARPHALDYIGAMFTDWSELHGDRQFGDDQAVVTGLARFAGEPVAVIGQQKGCDTKDNIHRNFAMMHPEGYRKAMRVMRLAEKFDMPLVILIDTPGAYPGIGAEERGQGEAIARNIMEMSTLRTPIVCTVIGEGASGGALGIGVGDRLLMMQYAWYCVISPEGCATIAWKDVAKAPAAAEALRLTAADLDELGIVDEIIAEPLGGAHRDTKAATSALKVALTRHLGELKNLPTDEMLELRFRKYRDVGQVAKP